MEIKEMLEQQYDAITALIQEQALEKVLWGIIGLVGFVIYTWENRKVRSIFS